MKYENKFFVDEREVSATAPTYFIADIAANHDGDLSRAKDLIYLAKEAGADVAKFQHFIADGIVSDYGFKSLGRQLSHQATWKKTVFETYQENECRREWTEELVKTAHDAKITVFTAPYDYDAVDLWDKYAPAFKIGSGDVTWTPFIETIAKKNKPVFLATGASCMQEVERAVEAVLKHNSKIVLMQCNTNYTASLENFKYINLNVIKTYAHAFPGIILGLSDHTPGHATVLGAVALGARVIEKHFTDDNNRIGPDHLFSMSPVAWRDMVDRTRELEYALGDGIKRVEANEQESVILQRRCIRFKRDMAAGEIITEHDVEYLRPAPQNAFSPWEKDSIFGRPLKVAKVCGDGLLHSDL
ncbi:N-acetylneuraminate synthase family protein [Candidatus Babeliales bacterium]|nr:N-acetylneuraminate synthase family protein [Candidatus Babeliales bacterium]